MAEAQWTDWSVFDQLTVKFDNPAQDDSVTEEEWQDSWFFALGSTFKATDTLDLARRRRLRPEPGQGRITARRASPTAIATGCRSAPAGSRPPGSTSTPPSPTSTSKTPSVDLAASDTGSTSRGNLEADYDSYILLLGLSARMRF